MTGRKANRPEFQRAMMDARSRKYDVLLFWSLDRISRQGALQTLTTLNTLAGYGVAYRSLQEQWIDSLGPFGEAIIGVIATVAKMEAERISARVKAGLSRALADGKQLGRRRIVLDQAKIAEMREKGMTLQEIACRTGASPMTVHRILHRAV